MFLCVVGLEIFGVLRVCQVGGLGLGGAWAALGVWGFGVWGLGFRV